MVLAQPENKHVLKAFDLTGKVAAITGKDVALIYNSSTNASSIANDIAAKNNVRAAAYQADVASQPDIERVIQQIASDFGKLDIIVVNSGIPCSVPAEECTVEQWHNVMKVNLDGAFYTAQAAARIFKTQGHGNVIFTASVSATLVNVPQKQAAYNASKAGVVRLAKCLSVEWVDFCRVNCISPGYIATEILDGFPQDWKDKWFDLIPAKRMAATYELKGVGL
ncbi:oxidoreductase [Aspergillus affinis]|uniref:oxidoreductase n=1 Tax=Aspergillus affinis TaxID=1070780 RepID=UPI0022FE7A21|nr:oxidoreductase [Aspergillus affinis]KAI9040587.1 oxidoreductase [Aspergillus affinis]